MFDTTFTNGNSVAALTGSLTYTEHNKFRDIARHLLASDSSCLVIDFSHLDFIDSAGLGMLLLLREEANTQSRPVVLRNARKQVKRLFELSCLDTLFTVEG